MILLQKKRSYERKYELGFLANSREEGNKVRNSSENTLENEKFKKLGNIMFHVTFVKN